MNQSFLTEKNKQTNAPISLILLEVSKAYFATATSSSTKTAIVIDSDEATFDFDPNTTGTGWATFISIESGKNKGAMRKVSSYSDYTFHFDEPLDFIPYDSDDSVGEKIRISRNLALADWDETVSFYIPDDSNHTGIALDYIPFPMKMELVGSNTTGELYTISASVDNVGRVIGDAIQVAKGLRGARIIHILTFYDVLDQGKDTCIKNVMCVDSITITPKDVVFSLESKMNIIGINLPFCNYNRDFCRWVYKSTECGFPSTGTGLNSDYILANANTCDHTLHGPNGCLAHGNSRRFGGFPALIGGN